MNWPGAPEMGSTIAKVLRAKVVKDKRATSSKHFKITRDREILGLAQIHADEGMTQIESHNIIAKYFGMTADAVRKTVTRKRLDK